MHKLRGNRMPTYDPTGESTGRRARTREALLDAAGRLWAEHGIRGVSLDDVARAAGLTKGAVYSNFTGKTDLLLALLDRHASTGSGPELSPALSSAKRPLAEHCEEAGEEFGRSLTGGDARLLALLLVELWLYGMRDFSVGWRIADWYEARRDRLADQLTEDATPSTLSATDRATLALALDIGLTLQHLLDPDRVPAGAYTTALNLILA